MRAPLLIELLTEELPPQSLQALGSAFGKGILIGLRDHQFVNFGAGLSSVLATPRRLAVIINDVLDHEPDSVVERRRIYVAYALYIVGIPTNALLGFARKITIDIDRLTCNSDTKGVFFMYRIS